MHRLARLMTFALATFLSGLVAAGDSVADEGLLSKPKRATVITAGAAVRSGPAESYYLTETLPQDTVVEVYRQQPDGWCAIRPNDASFSWVYSPHLRLIDDDIAEVNKDDVAARVGSNLSSQRDVVQVRMQKGEVVRLLEPADNDAAGWYKIAPPAGEFRWIHVQDLAIDGIVGSGVREDASVATIAHEAPLTGSQDSQWAAVAAPPLTTSAAPVPAASSFNYQALTPDTATGETGEVTPVASTPPSSPEIAKQLSDLELRLSRMVAEPTSTWSIEPLEQAAEQLLSNANTVEDRTAVKNTLAKIDRFAIIRRRSMSMNSPAATTVPRNVVPVIQGQIATPLPAASTAGSPQAAVGASQTSPYDAVGILRPVVSRRPGAPQFALVDEQGQVVTFITATPDTNLQPYLGRRIGVTGSRGYIPEFRRPHVTAGRVTPLQDTMRR